MTASDLRPTLTTRDGSRINRLGFGTLTLAKWQKDVSPEDAATLFRAAADKGINWFDTAEYYGNYDQLHVFLKQRDPRSLFISSKSYAYDYASMHTSIDDACRRLGVDCIDLFMLHEQENHKTLAGHRDAFQALLDAKARGRIRYAGISTHAVSAVKTLAAAKRGEMIDADFDTRVYRDADAVFALLSKTGIGLLDGDATDMNDACAEAHRAGLHVLGMKLFGGGHLLRDREAAVRSAREKTYVSAWSVGMGSIPEIETNLAWFRHERPGDALLAASAASARQLHVTADCSRCGRCVARCQSGAMSLGSEAAVSDPAKCTLCSYCAYVCRDFAIKVY